MNMAALLAMGVGVLMTAVGVIIGGLALELIMMAMRRALIPSPTGSGFEQAGKAVVIQFKSPDSATSMVELVKEAA
jgi:hypothetical protein